NPDYFINGQVVMQNQPMMEFRYDTYHFPQEFQGNSFYQRLFVQGLPQVRPELNTMELRAFLSQELPDYMIPGHFIKLDAFPLLPNGKINKLALPDPEEGAAATRAAYAPPRDKVEATLAEIWELVIGRQPIGIHDKYFSIGGDSIKAIQIASRLRQSNLSLQVIDIFQYPTIAQLAPRITSLEQMAGQEVISGTVPLTAIQAWFFEQHQVSRHHFNQSAMLFSKHGFDPAAIREALRTIQEHHDALRMRYHQNDDGLIQENASVEYPFSFEAIDLSHESDAMSRLESYAAGVQAGISLSTGPMMKAVLFHLPDGDRLLIVIHHLVIDTVSWRILLEDLATAYHQHLAGMPIKLPPKTHSFKYWAEHIHQYARNPHLLREKTYWGNLESTIIPPLPRDLESPHNLVRDSRLLEFTLSALETTDLLTQVHHAYNTEINDILLTALARSLKAWTGRNTALITLEGHGREQVIEKVDISRTVGWFTSAYPVILELPEASDEGYQIKYTKEILRRIPHKGFGYSILKYLTPGDLKQDLYFKLTPQISFNYLGRFDEDIDSELFRLVDEASGPPVNPAAVRHHDLDINCLVLSGRFRLSISYNERHYRAGTIQFILDEYKKALLLLLAHCKSRKSTELTPGDLTYKGLTLDDFDRMFANA
ncbi:MAG: non-ribosomal peptide synthetase, partial [Deltaproteobacteria bacterium]|nr:non-ribosomal peptide synthetase [Deltaproteobacteria bacterium]